MGSAFSLFFVFLSRIFCSSSVHSSQVGWPFSPEYKQNMLTVHDRHRRVDLCCGFMHVSTGGTGGVLKERAAVYFRAFLFNTITVWVSTPTAPIRWCAVFEKWGNIVIDMEMWFSQTMVGFLRQWENKLHSKQDLAETREWKDGFRLICNNSSGIPYFQHTASLYDLGVYRPCHHFLRSVRSWVVSHIFIYHAPG